MVMPKSGPISMSQINSEIVNVTATNPINLKNRIYKECLNKGLTQQVSMSDYYGKPAGFQRSRAISSAGGALGQTDVRFFRVSASTTTPMKANGTSNFDAYNDHLYVYFRGFANEYSAVNINVSWIETRSGVSYNCSFAYGGGTVLGQNRTDGSYAIANGYASSFGNGTPTTYAQQTLVTGALGGTFRTGGLSFTKTDTKPYVVLSFQTVMSVPLTSSDFADSGWQALTITEV